MKKLKFIVAISLFLLPNLKSEEVALDSPEGWGMSYMSAASLNLSDSFPTTMAFGEIVLTGELSNIPKLNREQQKIGFGGLKYEELNKSPVFGRGKLKVGFYWDSVLEVSYTPPLELKGAKPKNLWGIALSKQFINNDKLNLGLRYYNLSGKAVADVTCSQKTVNQPLYTAGNPSGCISTSKDKIDLGHQGFEIILASKNPVLNFRPWVSIATTKIDSSVRIDAQLELSREIAYVSTEGTLSTLNFGLNYPLSDKWVLNLGSSYTPLDAIRPTPAGGDDDFWNIKLGLSWNLN
ncbi:MAG: hypothetical protein CMQ57_01010 [Gammaproteobacteria bacterium]|nr:hypothetical protein [Gammaproteobacteria bacterium]